MFVFQIYQIKILLKRVSTFFIRQSHSFALAPGTNIVPASVRDDGISALLEPHSKTDTSMAASVMSVNQESNVSDDVDAGAFRLCLEPIQEVHARN